MGSHSHKSLPAKLEQTCSFYGFISNCWPIFSLICTICHTTGAKNYHNVMGQNRLINKENSHRLWQHNPLCFLSPFLLGPSSRHTRMWNQWSPLKLHLSINPQWKTPIWKPATVPHSRGSRWRLTPPTTRWWSAGGYAACTVSLARNLPRWEQVHTQSTDVPDKPCLKLNQTCYPLGLVLCDELTICQFTFFQK